MATTTIYADSRGSVTHIGATESDSLDAWNSARGGNTTTGNSVVASGNGSMGAQIQATRGGDFQGSCFRAYFYFDISEIGADDITAISATIIGGSSNSAGGDWRVVRANSDNDFGTIATSDFALVFNSSTQMTSYSNSASTWNPNFGGNLGVNTISLNATAVSNANSGGASAQELCIGLVNNTYDYENEDAEENFGQLINGVALASSGTGRALLTVTHQASGYGNEVNNIIPSKISKILGISSANISKVTGV
mgnify:FL=1|tara:strand:- start:47 stop:802 length:756 start_codon:yes stop_codon:yes gene_type:complete